MKTKQLDAIVAISAIITAIGVFLPLTRFAVIGDVSYNRIASLESYLVVLFCLSAPVFIFIKQPKFVFASVAGVWLTLLLPALKGLFKGSDSSVLGQISSKASSVMQEFAADIFLNVFKFSWGGYVFLLALLVFSAVTIKRGLAKR